MTTVRGSQLLETEIGGRYRLVTCLSDTPGSGVFEAYQDETQRLVILKLLYGAVAEDSLLAQRFNVQMGAARRVNHPNVVRVLDSGWDIHGLYVAMKVLRGQTLSQEIQRRPTLHPREAAAIAGSVVRGLQAAHSRGLVHCHLQPENVFLHKRGEGDVVVKVLNLGVAQFLNETCHSNQSTSEHFCRRSMLVRDYLAPELLNGDQFDGSADLYSVGVLCFQLLAGGLPLRVSLTGRAEIAEDAALLTWPPDTPQLFRKLVAQLLEVSPANRPRDIGEVVRVFESLRGGYRLGCSVPDGADAGRGVVPKSEMPAGNRGELSSRYRPYNNEKAGAGELVGMRTRQIEQRLRIPLKQPKRDPVGPASLFVMVIGFLVWWLLYEGL
jgi:serine/threonine protein kinase